MNQKAKTVNESSQERRIFPREPLDLPLSFQVVGGYDGPSRRGEGRLIDISAGGIAFTGKFEFPVGTVLRVKIPASDFAAKGAPDATQVAAKTVKGTIVNGRQLDDGSWRYGIQFDRLYYALVEWGKSLS